MGRQRQRTGWVAAELVDRPNRFVIRARLASARVVEAHLADPGRLTELLLPGVALRLAPVPAKAQRRTRFTAKLARSRRGSWVSLEATRANGLARSLLAEQAIRDLPPWPVRSEVREGTSRFDFLLEHPAEGRCWVEVKSVTHAERGVARFPDAPTSRGRRHLRELTHRVETTDDSAAVLFVVQRGDADCVEPYTAIDPAFTHALQDAAAAGVRLLACGFRLQADGRAVFRGSLPFRLEGVAGTQTPEPELRAWSTLEKA